jgi:hypothetical protein
MPTKKKEKIHGLVADDVDDMLADFRAADLANTPMVGDDTTPDAARAEARKSQFRRRPSLRRSDQAAAVASPRCSTFCGRGV